MDKILELCELDELKIPEISRDGSDSNWNGQDRRDAATRGSQTDSLWDKTPDIKPAPQPPAPPTQSPISQNPGSPADYGQCFSYMGVTGGVGVTTICVEMAYALAKKNTGNIKRKNADIESSVCLIDMDFDSGSCAHLLDLQPGISLKDLQTAPERIDRSMMTALAVQHGSGFDLFACGNSMGGNEKVNAETVVAILDHACQMYQTVIIDVPRFWRPWNTAAIAGADRFSLVTDLTIPSLHLAQSRMNALAEELGPDFDFDILISKFERRSFRNALKVKDAEQALGKTINSTICYDSENLRESINSGHPPSAFKADSRYARDIRTYVEQFMASQTRAKSAVA